MATYSKTSEMIADIASRLAMLSDIHGRYAALDMVAAAGGVSNGAVRKVFYGEVTNPTADTIDRILAGIAAVEQQAAA